MSALDAKPFGEESEDKSTGDMDSAMKATVKYDGRPDGSTFYDGKAGNTSHGNVSQRQFNNSGRK